jgi:hypothetical protein
MQLGHEVEYAQVIGVQNPREVSFVLVEYLSL